METLTNKPIIMTTRLVKASRRNTKRGKKEARPSTPSLQPLTLQPRPPPPHHLYMPQLHRQQTIFDDHLGPVGTVLAVLAKSRQRDDFSSSARLAAILEITNLVDGIYLGLSRNQAGLRFRKYAVANWYCHWQTEAEERIFCIVPVEVAGVTIRVTESGAAHFILPAFDSFGEGDTRRNVDFASDEFTQQRFVSTRKVYSQLNRMIRKGLVSKGVAEDRLRCSLFRRVMEVDLSGDADGWVAEFVPCLTVKGHSLEYCCKSFSRTEAGINFVQDICNTVSHSPSIVSMHASERDDISVELNTRVPVDDSSVCTDCETERLMKIDSLSVSPMKSRNEVNSETPLLRRAATNSQTPTQRSKQNHSNPSRVSRNNVVTNTSWYSKKRDNEVQTPTKTKHGFNVNDNDEEPGVNHPDVTWYVCGVKKENKVLDHIYRTDGGVRISAAQIVHSLCQADWRLRDVTAYHVQTTMLHDTEIQLDNSPRWQRDELEHCVRSILAKLLECAQARCLPHFLFEGVTLWADIPTKRLSLTSGALARLTSNDIALLSLISRAGGFTLPAGVRMYSTLLKNPSIGKSLSLEGASSQTCSGKPHESFNIESVNVLNEDRSPNDYAESLLQKRFASSSVDFSIIRRSGQNRFSDTP